MNLSTLREDIRDVSDDLLDAIEGVAQLAIGTVDADMFVTQFDTALNVVSAAQNERLRRASIDPPHSPGCVCHDCAGARIEVTND